jgi:hypothetical protein
MTANQTLEKSKLIQSNIFSGMMEGFGRLSFGSTAATMTAASHSGAHTGLTALSKPGDKSLVHQDLNAQAKAMVTSLSESDLLRSFGERSGIINPPEATEATKPSGTNPTGGFFDQLKGMYAGGSTTRLASTGTATPMTDTTGHAGHTGTGDLVHGGTPVTPSRTLATAPARGGVAEGTSDQRNMTITLKPLEVVIHIPELEKRISKTVQAEIERNESGNITRGAGGT